MSVVKKDVELLAMLLHSLPPIFRNKGTPNDLNFILSHLKQAVVYRGVSSDVQKLLIDLLVPFSKFKAGFIGVRELNTTFQEATSAILRPTRPVKKVLLVLGPQGGGGNVLLALLPWVFVIAMVSTCLLFPWSL